MCGRFCVPFRVRRRYILQSFKVEEQLEGDNIAMKRRVLAWVTAAAMLLTSIPGNALVAFAEETAEASVEEVQAQEDTALLEEQIAEPAGDEETILLPEEMEEDLSDLSAEEASEDVLVLEDDDSEEEADGFPEEDAFVPTEEDDEASVSVNIDTEDSILEAADAPEPIAGSTAGTDAEENEVSSIDLKVNGSDDRGTIVVPQYDGSWNDFEVEIHYMDGSSLVVNRWNSSWIEQDDGTGYYYLHSHINDYPYCIRFARNGGLVADIPGDSTGPVWFDQDYTVYVYASEDQMKSNDPSDQVTIQFTRGSLYEINEDITLDPYGHARIHFPAQAESEEFRYGLKGTQGSVYAVLYEEQDDDSYSVSSSRIGKPNTTFTGNAESEYVLDLQAGEEGWTGSGFVAPQRTLSSVAISQEELSIPAYQLRDRLENLAVTVTYEDGTEEILTNWPITIYGESFDQNTLNGDYVYLLLKDQDGNLCSIPNFAEDSTYEFSGTYTVEAAADERFDDESGEYYYDKTSSVNWTVYSDAAPEDAMELDTEYAISAAAPENYCAYEWHSFTAPEEGAYKVTASGSWEGVYIYRKNEESVWERDDNLTIFRHDYNATQRVTLADQEKILIAVVGPYSYWDEATNPPLDMSLKITKVVRTVQPIEENTWYTAQIEETDGESWFSITPVEDGFYSLLVSGDEDYNAALYNMSQTEIASNKGFWGGEDRDYAATAFTKKLQKGVTYSFFVSFSEGQVTGSFEIMMKKEADRNPLPLELETPIDAVITEYGECAYFSYVPEETGTYLFSSNDPNGKDTSGYLYDESWNELAYDYDDAGNNQFLVSEELEQGRTYYFGAKYDYRYQTGSFPVVLMKKENPENVSMNVPDTLEVLGYWSSLKNMSLTLTYKDGDTETVSDWREYSQYVGEDLYIETLRCTSRRGSQYVLSAKYKDTDQYLNLQVSDENSFTVREGDITLSLIDCEDEGKVWQTKEIKLIVPSDMTTLAPETEDTFRIAKGQSKVYKLSQDAEDGQELKFSFYSSNDVNAYVFDQINGEYVLTRYYDEESGTWSRSLDGNDEASGRYLVLNSIRDTVNGVFSYDIGEAVPEGQYEVTGIALKGNLAKTSVLEGRRVKNEDGEETPWYVDLSGLSVEVTYKGQNTENYPANKFNLWGACDGINGEEMDLRVYESGTDPETEDSRAPGERLPAGTYDLIAKITYWVVTDGDELEKTLYSAPIPFTVKSLKEASDGQVLSGESITLNGVGNDYDVFSWTPEKDGTQGFSADKPLTFRQILDAESGEELAILSDGGNDFYSTEFTADREYLFVLGADKAVTSVTISKKAVEGQISEEGVKLTETVDHTEPLLAGIDGVRKQEFGVEYTYENGQSMTLVGDEQDAYDNQFRYEVREKNSQQVMMSDADNNPLGIGTYLVQAIHRTLSAIRSYNTVDLTVTLPQMETLDEISVGESMTIEPMQRSLLRFTAPKEDRYWLVEGSNGYVNGSFYEINEEGDRMEEASQPLSKGKEYLIVIEKNAVEKTVTVQSSSSQSEVPDDVTPTQLTLNKRTACSLGIEEKAWYVFNASKDGDYHFEVTGGSIATMLQDGYCFNGTLNGDGMFFTGAYDTMYGNISMKAGDRAVLMLRSWNRPESGISVLVTEGKTPVALEVQAKTGDDLKEQKWQYIFQGNMLRLFGAKIIYQDGTYYTFPAGSMEDPYGYKVDCEGDRRKNGNQLKVYATCFVCGREENEDGDFEKLDTVAEVLATASFSLDPSELPQLTINNPLSITPDQDVYYQPFAFTAPSKGVYVVKAEKSTLQRAVWISWDDDETGYYDSNDTDGIIKLSEGETALLAVVTDASEPIEISASLKKDPTALSLAKAAKGRFAQLEDVSRSGMQATVTYSDGTTEIIKAGDDTDPYGNVVKTTEAKLANGKTRITMTCGIYSVSSDTENLTVDEVQRVTTADSVIEVNHKGRTLVALDVAKDGTYRINSPQDLIQTGLAAVYDDTLKMTIAQGGTVQLTAGKRTLMSFVVDSGSPDTITVKLIRTDYDPCEGGHTPDTEWTVKKEATCTKDGLKVKLCTVCGNEVEKEVIPKLDHAWNLGIVTTEATCTEEGVRTYTCSRCGYTKTESIPATGIHDWDNGEETTAPTCTKEGVRTYHCRNCEETKTEPIDKIAHQWETTYKVDKEATTTETGIESIHCHVCGAVKPDSEREIPVKTISEVVEEAVQNADDLSNLLQDPEKSAEEKEEAIVEYVADLTSGASGQALDEDGQLAKNEELIGDGNASTQADLKGLAEKVDEVLQDQSLKDASIGTTIPGKVTVGGETLTVGVAGATAIVADAILDEAEKAPENVEGQTYRAKVNVTVDSERTDDTQLCLGISVSVINKDTEQPINQESVDVHALPSPVTITITLPEAFQNINLIVFHTVNGQDVEVKFTWNEDKTAVSFPVPSMSPFRVEAGIADLSAYGDTLSALPSGTDLESVYDETTVSAVQEARTAYAQATKEGEELRESQKDQLEVLKSKVNNASQKVADEDRLAVNAANTALEALNTKNAADYSDDTKNMLESAAAQAEALTGGTAIGKAQAQSIAAELNSAVQAANQEEEAARANVTTALNELAGVNEDDYAETTAQALKAAREAAENPSSASMGELNNMLSKLNAASTAVKAEDQATKDKIDDLKKQLDAIDESKYADDPEALAAIRAAKSAVNGLSPDSSKAKLNEVLASLNTMSSSVQAADKRMEEEEKAKQEQAKKEKAKEEAKKANQAKAAFKLNVANGGKVPLQVKKTSKKIVIKKIASFDKVTSVTSSNSKVVTAKLAGNAISIKGGKKPGSAKVTVKTKYGASVTFTVKVQKKKVAAKKIAGVSKKLTMNVGQTIVLDAATNPLTAPDKIKFKSSAKKIVSVTKKGVIKAKKKGKATITIKAGKAKLKVKITVK